MAPMWGEIPISLQPRVIHVLQMYDMIPPRHNPWDARPVWDHLEPAIRQRVWDEVVSSVPRTRMYAATATHLAYPEDWSYDNFPYTPLEQVSMVKVKKKQTTPIDMLVVEEDPDGMA